MRPIVPVLEHGHIIPPEALGGASVLSATRRPAAERPFCYDCFRPRDACVCRTITPVDNRTPVLIVQHPRERFHPLGTVRLAKRALSRVRVAIWGDTFAHQASWLDEPLPAGAALLFPSPRARPLDELQPAEYPQTLVVIDGTWTQARRILRASPALAALPHVCLAPRTPSLYRVRAEPAEHYRSTIEAISGALALLEPDNLAVGGLTQLVKPRSRGEFAEGGSERFVRCRRVLGRKLADGERGLGHVG